MKREIQKDRLEQKKIKYCFNDQRYDSQKLKFIIVGDNPGDTEYAENKFFIGKSGQILRNHFDTHNLCDDFDKECAVYNKTYIHTSKTKDLELVRKKIGNPLFDDILEDCAIEIGLMSNELNVPILILGKSHLKEGKLFSPFWLKLKSVVNNPDHLLVYSHVSMGNFSKEWIKYKKDLEYMSSLDLLLKIGRKNTKIL